MSKTISYRGTLDMGQQDRIRLSTLNGKTGYKITNFQIIGTTPGQNSPEYIAEIYKTDQTGSIGYDVQFTNSDLLAVAFLNGNTNPAYASNELIIFDNEKINQDIYVSITDATGGTVPCNYYIELETMSLSDIEATMLTLQSIRTVTAPTGSA